MADCQCAINQQRLVDALREHLQTSSQVDAVLQIAVEKTVRLAFGSSQIPPPSCVPVSRWSARLSLMVQPWKAMMELATMTLFTDAEGVERIVHAWKVCS